jgi:hypothetical protein
MPLPTVLYTVYGIAKEKNNIKDSRIADMLHSLVVAALNAAALTMPTCFDK